MVPIEELLLMKMSVNFKIKPHGGAPKILQTENELINVKSNLDFNLPKAQVLDSSNAPTMQPATQLLEIADPVATNDPQQVTQFIDDTGKQETSLPFPIVPNKDILAAGLEDREHNIVDVLERPVKLESFTWSDTQTFDTEIKSYDFPESIISSAPNVADKIAHFTFLRAHIEVRFVVNANTFQAGRLLAYFAPFSNASEIGDRVNVNNYMSAKTVFPRVVLDASSGNVGVLTIPYVSYFTHYDLARGIGDLGTVRISVLNPLQSGSATVTVFGRFTNISLQIPTAVPNNLGSISGIITDLKTHILRNPECKTQCFRDKFRQLLSGVTEKVAPGRYRRSLEYEDLFDNVDLPQAQVGEAVAKASSGVISTPLSTIGRMASMGRSLPVIGDYLAPISWISNAAAGVASYFGLSKSANLVPLNKFVTLPAYGYTQADGVDNSLVLGSCADNEIGTRQDVFGSDVDEMDIPFICKHESFLTSFLWNNSAIPGTILFKTVVSPGAMDYKLVDGNPIFNSTALGYVSSMFKFWRGSTKFKIQVTKTAYHSGRLRISFVPSGKADVTSLNSYDFNQGYSEIVDLRTSDEIEFTIPFVSNTIWKPAILNQYDSPTNYEATTGVLVVEVLNQLRNPDTVATVLNCNVWVSGGDDIQFAVPDFSQNMPVTDDSTTVRFLDGEEQELFDKNPQRYAYSALPKAQVLGQLQDTGFNQTMENANEMFTAPRTSAVDASATCIGEHTQNLRTVIKRFGIFGSSSIGTNKAVKIKSNYFGIPAKATANGINLVPIDYVSWLYRFYRGGVRYKALVQPKALSGPIGVVADQGIIQTPSAFSNDAANVAEYGRLLNQTGTFSHFIDTIYNRFLEFTLPYFSNTHISLLRGTGITPSNFDDRSSAAYLFGNSADGEDDITMFKAAGDDFSFGWLVGPPKLKKIPPAGTTLAVTPSGATVVVSDTAAINVRSVGNTSGLFTPVFDEDVIKTVLYSTVPTVQVFYTDASFDTVPIVGTSFAQSATYQQWTIPRDVSKTLDATATLAAIKAIANFSVRVPS